MAGMWVKPSTAKALRDEMGYKDPAPMCSNCNHFMQVTGSIGGSSLACDFFVSKIGIFPVEPTGSCKFHETQEVSPCA